MDDDAMFLAYADALLPRCPASRMNNSTQKKQTVSGSEPEGIILSYYQVL